MSSVSSLVAAWGPAAQLIIGRWEKLCFVLLVLHILSSSSSSPSFVVLLNCLYLNPWSFTLCPFSSSSHREGESEWAAAWTELLSSGCMVLVDSCPVKPWHGNMTLSVSPRSSEIDLHGVWTAKTCWGEWKTTTNELFLCMYLLMPSPSSTVSR